MTEPRKTSQGPRVGRHPLLWIAAIAIAPIVASYAIYYFFPKAPTANYGTLMPTAPIPGIEGARPDGSPFRLDELRGRWVLVAHGVGGGACDVACERRLYATRQARTIQGKEQERVVRVLLVTGGTAPPAAWLAQHPGLVVASVTEAVAAKFPAGPSSLYLIDPLGNLVLSYPDDPDIKGIARDLTRLLKASRIG